MFHGAAMFGYHRSGHLWQSTAAAAAADDIQEIKSTGMLDLYHFSVRIQTGGLGREVHRAHTGSLGCGGGFDTDESLQRRGRTGRGRWASIWRGSSQTGSGNR